MAKVGRDVIYQLWNNTPEYSWRSLRQVGLPRVVGQQLITDELYYDLINATRTFESQGVDFPHSDTELYSRLQYYL